MELKFDLNDPQYQYITNLEEANVAIEALEKEKVISIDTEATSLDPYSGHLLIIQIASPTFCYIFDPRRMDLRGLERFKNLLENRSILKLLQNAKFDYKYIKIHMGIMMDNIYDTMLSEAVLNSGLGKAFYGLKELTKVYLGLDLKKETRETFETLTKSSRLTKEQLSYAAIDALILHPIFEQQLEKLHKTNLLNIAKLEFATTRVVGDMELTGIYIDKVKWRGIIKDLGAKREKFAEDFQLAIKPYFAASAIDLFGNTADYINMNSNAQLMELFNKKLKLNILSTGDEVLATVNHPVAKILRDYRGYEKLVSAFGEKLLDKINKKTGRLHPEFNQMGTATGRFSCNNPNLQQIPHNSAEVPFRECFNPKPGYKLVVADYSSFEMRILADLSGDERMIKALNDDLDIHSYTAALMFGKEYTSDFKKLYPDLRRIAKPIGFGLMYGMGPAGLAGQIECSVEDAQEYMEKYFANYPSVRDFLDRVAKEAIQKGWSTTSAGRKRWYDVPEKNDPEYKKKISRIQRMAKNHPIQGTNADAVKYALVFINERLKKDGVDGAITHTIHDEIVTEVREDQAQDWSMVQSKEMVRAAEMFIKKVAVVSDPFVGDVWEH